MLYFNQSIYIHSHIETPHGVRRLSGGGIWQFRPETMELEVFIRGLWSTPGATTSTAGASRSPPTGRAARGSTTAFPGAYYVTAPDAVADPARA